MFSYFLILVIGIGSTVACKNKKEPILAKVYDDHLYLSDTKGIISKDLSKEDSISLLNLFVENWVREKLFENEAKKRISDKEKIEKQVKAYRASLINYAYESLIIKEQLDSILDDELLEDFYNKNKSSFKLDVPLMKCRFIKISKTKQKVTPIKALWQSTLTEDREQLIKVCVSNAQLFMLEDTIWNNANEILYQFPKNKISSADIANKKEFIFEDDNYSYYLKVIKWLPVGETAPFQYAKKKISDIFLIQRKKELVEKTKDKIFEKESRRHNFSIYTNRLKVKSENKE